MERQQQEKASFLEMKKNISMSEQNWKEIKSIISEFIGVNIDNQFARLFQIRFPTATTEYLHRIV